MSIPAPWYVADYRTFNGQSFHYYKSYKKKKTAQSVATRFRKQGYNVRLIHTKGFYVVYTSKRKLRKGERKKR